MIRQVISMRTPEDPFAQKKESERLGNFNITGFKKLWLRLLIALILVDKQPLAWKGHECSKICNVFLSNTQVTDTVGNFSNLTKESASYCYFNKLKKNEMSNYGHHFHQVACPNGKTPFTISPLLLRLATVYSSRHFSNKLEGPLKPVIIAS